MNNKKSTHRAFIQIEGRKKRFKIPFFEIFNILSLGIYNIITRNFLNFKISLETVKCNVKNASLLKIANEYMYTELIKVKTIYIPFKSRRLKAYMRDNRIKYFESSFQTFFFDYITNTYVVTIQDRSKIFNSELKQIFREKQANYSNNNEITQEYVNQLLKADIFKELDIQQKENIIRNQELIENFILYGRNTTDPKPKKTYEIFIDNIASPLFIYNLIGIILWFGIDYELYAGVILVITIYSTFSEIYQNIQKNKAVVALSEKSKLVNCFRMGKWQSIDSRLLFPGDLIYIDTVNDFFCDVKLLKGEVISDESFLTGEAVPVFKSANSSSNIIFSGTKILKSYSEGNDSINIDIQKSNFVTDEIIKVRNLAKNKSFIHTQKSNLNFIKNSNRMSDQFETQQLTRNASNNLAMGVIISTGFNTSKGRLVKNIMIRKPTNFAFYSESMKFIFGIFLIGFTLNTILFFFLIYKKTEFKTAFNYSTDLIYCLISPALPNTIWVGLHLATKRLRKKFIICNEAKRVNLAGIVDMAVFDKTGTLTEEGLDILCLDTLEKQYESISEVPFRVLQAISTCHSVFEVDNQIMGDLLDMKMFSFSEANIKCDKYNRNIIFNYNTTCENYKNEEVMKNSNFGNNKIDFDNNNSSSKQEKSFDDITYCDENKSDPHENQNIIKFASCDTIDDNNDSLREIEEPIKSASFDNDNYNDERQPKIANKGVCHAQIIKLHDFDNKLRRMSVIISSKAVKSKNILKKQEDLNEHDLIHRLNTSNSQDNENECFIGFTDNIFIIKNQKEEFITDNINTDSLASKEEIVTKKNEGYEAIYKQKDDTKLNTEEEYIVFTKGSPESLKELLNKIPSDYDEQVQDYALEGFRIITVAYKKINRNQKLENRSDIEKDLNFLCFIVFANKLKSETKEALKELEASNITTKMATGDNILTAISVGRQSGMIDKYVPIIFPVIDENTKSVFDVEWLCVSDFEIIFDRFKLTLHKEHESVVYSDFYVACEGREYEFFRQAGSDYFEFILSKGKIFARMNPDQKKMLVEDLTSSGYSVCFCGDGANDCGALSSAAVGLSLADNESSLASSFISTRKNISSVPILIKEGRSALITSIHSFIFITIAGFVQYLSLYILSYFFFFFSDIQTIHGDLFLVLPLAFYMSKFKPSETLYIKQPQHRLFTKENLKFFIGAFLKNVVLYIMIISYFVYKGIDIIETGKFRKTSFVGTALFYITNFQIIVYSYIITQGSPHRERKSRKISYIIIFCLLTLYNIFLVFLPRLDIHNFIFDSYKLEKLETPYVFLILSVIIISTLFTIVLCFKHNRDSQQKLSTQLSQVHEDEQYEINEEEASV